MLEASRQVSRTGQVLGGKGHQEGPLLGTKARQAAQLTLEQVSTPKLSGESKY